jgi:hypothetical protein
MKEKLDKQSNTQTNKQTNKQNGNSFFDIKEGFDGIRKSNSRIIFAILLGIIILDFAYECID